MVESGADHDERPGTMRFSRHSVLRSLFCFSHGLAMLMFLPGLATFDAGVGLECPIMRLATLESSRTTAWQLCRCSRAAVVVGSEQLDYTQATKQIVMDTSS
jgi:hypothetical protein